jgi:cbb3-type cytochrome oxidase subunit 3
MNNEHEFITILAMLAFTITYLLVMLTLYKKEPKNNEDNPAMKK